MGEEVDLLEQVEAILGVRRSLLLLGETGVVDEDV